MRHIHGVPYMCRACRKGPETCYGTRPLFEYALRITGMARPSAGYLLPICLLSSVPAAASEEGQQVDEEVDKVEIKVQGAYD